jgi:hypothetical protein
MQIKLASVKLARLYMKRVAAELDHLAAGTGEPLREFLLLQGVRFAFRVHQVLQSISSLRIHQKFICIRTFLFSKYKNSTNEGGVSIQLFAPSFLVKLYVQLNNISHLHGNITKLVSLKCFAVCWWI